MHFFPWIWLVPTLGALVYGGLGVSPEDFTLNLALQSSLQVTITQLAVRDSGFVQ